jgi:hypothetical protein
MFNIISTCKGGGYMYAKTYPLHPNANSKGLYPLHRVMMENLIGRLLTRKEIVHHKDGNKSNNKITNLELMTISEHSTHHAKIVDEIIVSCAYCGKEIKLKPHLYRLRVKRVKVGISCSYKCAAKLFHKS